MHSGSRSSWVDTGPRCACPRATSDLVEDQTGDEAKDDSGRLSELCLYRRFIATLYTHRLTELGSNLLATTRPL
jgi:hypothetical protein